MSSIKISATFNKQTKDSKKELVQFHVKGQDEHKPELNIMCREAVELEIEGVEQKLTAKFEKKTQDANKTTLDFILMGNPSTNNSFEFYRMAGQSVNLTITESQMSIEELEEAHKGMQYTANPDGTVDVDKNQLTIEETDAGSESGENVTDLEKERAKRMSKKEKEEEASRLAAEAAAASGGAGETKPTSDDDELPF